MDYKTTIFITVLKFTNAALVRLIIKFCKTISCTKEMFLGFIDILRFKIIIKGKNIEEEPMTREACETKDEFEVDKTF